MNVCSVKYLNAAAQQNVPGPFGASGYYQCENRRKRCVGGGRNGAKNPNDPIFNFETSSALRRAGGSGSTHMVQYLKTRTIIYTSTTHTLASASPGRQFACAAAHV